MTDELFSAADLERGLHVPYRVITYLIECGRLAPTMSVSGRHLFDQAALRRLFILLAIRDVVGAIGEFNEDSAALVAGAEGELVRLAETPYVAVELKLPEIDAAFAAFMAAVQEKRR